MKFISILLFLVLTAIAGIHAYWAFGGLWPAATERALIDMVIGDPGFHSMPATSMTLIVAGLIFTTAVIALLGGGVLRVLPVGLTRILALGAGLVYFARGVAGYFFEQVAWTPAEPFATLNVLFYSPLCLAIGSVFVVLAFANHKH